MHRRRTVALAAVLAATLPLAACSGSNSSAPVVVTQTSYVPGAPSGAGSAGAPSSSAQAGTTAGSTAAGSTAAGSTPAPASKTGTPQSGATKKVVTANSITEPDGFVVTKLKPGQKPPQFIAVSFDGAGWHEKWQYYFGIAQKVPFHFTANLTGLYLLDEAHKTAYKGPGHAAGATALGANSWNTPAEVKQQIVDMNQAYSDGDEIATHFMGHFCDSAGDSPGGNSWKTADWNSELDQFFNVWKTYKSIDQAPGLPTLNVPASEVTGERTPCLEGKQEQLFPALVAHHMTYDQSFTHRGVSWPTQSPQYKIWNMGMAEFPLHGIAPGQGANHFQITMDYNFWYSQEFDAATGKMKKVSQAQSTADAAQVTATYQDMLAGAMAGSHAPLLLGNHFNEWNNNAYTEALGNFILANCGKASVHCVPYRDVVDWMTFQDPKVMAALQAEAPILHS